MKIKMTVNLSTMEGPYIMNREYELPEATAVQWCAAGIAVAVVDVVIMDAVKSEPMAALTSPAKMIKAKKTKVVEEL